MVLCKTIRLKPIVSKPQTVKLQFVIACPLVISPLVHSLLSSNLWFSSFSPQVLILGFWFLPAFLNNNLSPIHNFPLSIDLNVNGDLSICFIYQIQTGNHSR